MAQLGVIPHTNHRHFVRYQEIFAATCIKHLLTHSEGWYGDILFRSPEDVNAIAWLVDEKLPTLPPGLTVGLDALL